MRSVYLSQIGARKQSRTKRGGGVSGPPGKITKIYGFLAVLMRIPLKSQSYIASIQCWAIISARKKMAFAGRLMMAPL